MRTVGNGLRTLSPVPRYIGNGPWILLRGPTAMTYKSISYLQVGARSELTKERQQIERRKFRVRKAPWFVGRASSVIIDRIPRSYSFGLQCTFDGRTILHSFKKSCQM